METNTLSRLKLEIFWWEIITFEHGIIWLLYLRYPMLLISLMKLWGCKKMQMRLQKFFDLIVYKAR